MYVKALRCESTYTFSGMSVMEWVLTLSLVATRAVLTILHGLLRPLLVLVSCPDHYSTTGHLRNVTT